MYSILDTLNSKYIRKDIKKGISNNTDEDRSFEGWLSVAVVDRQGDYIDVSQYNPIIQKLKESGRKISIIAGHTNKVCGVADSMEVKTHPETNTPGLYIKAHIYNDYDSEDDIFSDLQNGYYNSLSVGGKASDKNMMCDNRGSCKNDIGGLEIYEASLTDYPANPYCTITKVGGKIL